MRTPFEQSCFDKEISILKIASHQVMTDAIKGATSLEEFSCEQTKQDAKASLEKSMTIIKEGIAKLTAEEKDLILAMHLQETVKSSVTKAVLHLLTKSL